MEYATDALTGFATRQQLIADLTEATKPAGRRRRSRCSTWAGCASTRSSTAGSRARRCSPGSPPAWSRRWARSGRYYRPRGRRAGGDPRVAARPHRAAADRRRQLAQRPLLRVRAQPQLRRRQPARRGRRPGGGTGPLRPAAGHQRPHPAIAGTARRQPRRPRPPNALRGSVSDRASRLHPPVGRTSKPRSPSGGSSTTSTAATAAPRGPRSHQRCIASTASSSPSISASTLPSPRLRTQPDTPRQPGRPQRRQAEADPLDAAVDDETTPDHLSQTRPVRRRITAPSAPGRRRRPARRTMA